MLKPFRAILFWSKTIQNTIPYGNSNIVPSNRLRRRCTLSFSYSDESISISADCTDVIFLERLCLKESVSRNLHAALHPVNKPLIKHSLKLLWYRDGFAYFSAIYRLLVQKHLGSQHYITQLPWLYDSKIFLLDMFLFLKEAKTSHIDRYLGIREFTANSVDHAYSSSSIINISTPSSIHDHSNELTKVNRCIENISKSVMEYMNTRFIGLLEMEKYFKDFTLKYRFFGALFLRNLPLPLWYNYVLRLTNNQRGEKHISRMEYSFLDNTTFGSPSQYLSLWNDIFLSLSGNPVFRSQEKFLSAHKELIRLVNLYYSSLEANRWRPDLLKKVMRTSHGELILTLIPPKFIRQLRKAYVDHEYPLEYTLLVLDIVEQEQYFVDLLAEGIEKGNSTSSDTHSIGATPLVSDDSQNFRYTTLILQDDQLFSFLLTTPFLDGFFLDSDRHWSATLNLFKVVHQRLILIFIMCNSKLSCSHARATNNHRLFLSITDTILQTVFYFKFFRSVGGHWCGSLNRFLSVLFLAYSNFTSLPRTTPKERQDAFIEWYNTFESTSIKYLQDRLRGLHWGRLLVETLDIGTVLTFCHEILHEKYLDSIEAFGLLIKYFQESDSWKFSCSDELNKLFLDPESNPSTLNSLLLDSNSQQDFQKSSFSSSLPILGEGKDIITSVIRHIGQAIVFSFYTQLARSPMWNNLLPMHNNDSVVPRISVGAFHFALYDLVTSFIKMINEESINVALSPKRMKMLLTLCIVWTEGIGHFCGKFMSLFNFTETFLILSQNEFCLIPDELRHIVWKCGCGEKNPLGVWNCAQCELEHNLHNPLESSVTTSNKKPLDDGSSTYHSEEFIQWCCTKCSNRVFFHTNNIVDGKYMNHPVFNKFCPFCGDLHPSLKMARDKKWVYCEKCAQWDLDRTDSKSSCSFCHTSFDYIQTTCPDCNHRSYSFYICEMCGKNFSKDNQNYSSSTYLSYIVMGCQRCFHPLYIRIPPSLSRISLEMIDNFAIQHIVHACPFLKDSDSSSMKRTDVLSLMPYERWQCGCGKWNSPLYFSCHFCSCSQIQKSLSMVGINSFSPPFKFIGFPINNLQTVYPYYAWCNKCEKVQNFVARFQHGTRSLMSSYVVCCAQCHNFHPLERIRHRFSYIFCPTCHQIIPAGSSFCPFCSRTLTAIQKYLPKISIFPWTCHHCGTSHSLAWSPLAERMSSDYTDFSMIGMSNVNDFVTCSHCCHHRLNPVLFSEYRLWNCRACGNRNNMGFSCGICFALHDCIPREEIYLWRCVTCRYLNPSWSAFCCRNSCRAKRILKSTVPHDQTGDHEESRVYSEETMPYHPWYCHTCHSYNPPEYLHHCRKCSTSRESSSSGLLGSQKNENSGSQTSLSVLTKGSKNLESNLVRLADEISSSYTHIHSLVPPHAIAEGKKYNIGDILFFIRFS